MKRIGVLTSGGDAPGMNAAIRAVVRTALDRDMSVVGFKRGYNGMLMRSPDQRDDFEILTASSVSNRIHRGGTFLMTARCLDFLNVENQKQAIRNLKTIGVEGLVCIGGDGTYKGAEALYKLGFPTVGVPGTIDNDLAYTDYTIGFDTAVNTCVDNINKLRDTMASHGRVSVVDVMGRGCGDIAVHSGIAAGAEAILIPEIKKTDNQWLDYLVSKLRTAFARGKKYGIIVMAEGVYATPKMHHFTADYIASWLNANSEIIGHRVDARGCVIGHVQRGGSPTATDRILAARMGEKAVDLLREGQGGLCVGIVKNRIVAVEIEKALAMKRRVDKHLIELADILAR